MAKKVKQKVLTGIAHIHASYNNTIVTLTDTSGNTLAWASSGAAGFKWSRKSTPFAAQTAAEKAVEKVKDYGLEKVSVKIKGIWPGREQAIRWLYQSGLDISSIKDITPTPHNWCRAKGVRRI